MIIEKRIVNNTLNISLSGKLNTVSAPQFASALNDLDGITELIIDFADLEQITSAGLRVLLDVQCNLNEKQGNMVVKNVSSVIYEVFELTGFINFLTIE